VVAPVDDLGALLDRMTPDTFHEDMDFAPPTGAEIW
jgi:antitoxin component of MazEF toxin-antitoxin module